MKFFNSLSFHHRIFLLVGSFAAISIFVLWFLVRPLYEDQIVEERSTVVQQLQHYALRNADEQLRRWIDVALYLSWNLQHRPSDTDVLMRQQIAFDTAVVQIVVSSPNLQDEFVVTSSLYPNAEIRTDESDWLPYDRDSSVLLMWRFDSVSSHSYFGVRKSLTVNDDPLTVTLYTDARPLLQQLASVPIGTDVVVQIRTARGRLFRTAPIEFPELPAKNRNVTAVRDVTTGDTEWKLFTSLFSAVPAELIIGIPTATIVAPAQQLLLYSTGIVVALTAFVFLFGWIFSRQLSRPLTQLVGDVEHLLSLDFSRPVSIPRLPEIAAVAAAIESMRTVLERYQRINVEKIIVEEWKNKFFLSHSEDAICITDEQERFTFMNDRFLELKKTLEQHSPVGQKRHLWEHPNVERSKESSRTESSGPYAITFHQKEIRVDMRTEEHSYFRMNDVSIVRDGEPIGSLTVLHDLTDERRIEAMKTEMMNFIVHELRNPLNSIMGFSSFLLDDPDMGAEERTEYVKIIQEGSRTMNHLVNRFLEVQRLESRTVDYHTEPTDLVATAKLVCDSQKPQLAAKSLFLTFTAESGIPPATVSPDLMREAFLNLVSNAIKYGDEHRTIEVVLRRENDSVLFVITDHGYGISAEDQQKLFSKFFRVTSNKKAALQIGTGLGLAHVKEVMTFHKGSVMLESNAEIGCRFTLTIPLT